MRIRLHISALTILLLLTTVSAAQDIKALKAGVVRIKNNNSGEVGAGFIVGIDKDLIYIVTASHVVKGGDRPQVYLFNNQFQPLSAEQINRDDDNPKGLALILVRSPNGQTPSGLATLMFADSSEVNGGEGVKIIGFPASSSFWDVSAGIISRLEGNNLIFAAPIRGGNSGGPVILSDGRVIGMVTDTTESQGTSSAPKADVIVSYVKGLVPGLIDSNLVGIRKVTPSKSKNDDKPPDTSINNPPSGNRNAVIKGADLDLVRFQDGNGKYGYRNQNGTIVIAAHYDRAFSFSNGLANVELNGKRGYINERDETVIPLIYEYLGFFHDGLGIAKLNRKYGFIDPTGRVVIPIQYDYVGFFHEGLANAELHGKYGFIDTQGRVVLAFRFDHALWFSGGRAKVQMGGREFYIDKDGNEVAPK